MDLTKEQQALLDTQFPAEIEKQAAAEAAMAFELYEVGFEKMASEAAEKMDEEAKEEKKEEDKKELSEEQEKEAQSRAAFIARGFIDGLMEKGASQHGNAYHYLIPAISDKLAADPGKVSKFLADMGAKAKPHLDKAKEVATKGADKVKEHVTAHKGKYTAGGSAAAGFVAGRASKGDKK
jgi:hypothetical protein